MPRIKLEKVRAPLLAGVLALIPAGAIAAGMGGAMPMHSGAMTPPRTAPNVPGIKPSGSGRAQTGDMATTGVDSHTRFIRQEPVTGTRLRSPVPVTGLTDPGVGVPVPSTPSTDTSRTVVMRSPVPVTGLSDPGVGVPVPGTPSTSTGHGPIDPSADPRTLDPPPPPKADTQ